MNRRLAKQLKAAGFPIRFYEVGHKFYPHEEASGWSEAAHRDGVGITPYELQDHRHDIAAGYYCPTLPDLIEACGDRFARLYVVTAVWKAESDQPRAAGVARSAEAAVAKLWLALRAQKAL